MANHTTADEVAPNIYELRHHESVQVPTPAMLAGVTGWPTVTVSATVEDGTEPQTTERAAKYAAIDGGAFVALADDALTVWEAARDAAAFAQLAMQHAANIMELARLLGVFGLTMPVTEDDVKAAIYASDPSMALDAMKLQDDYDSLRAELTDKQMVEIGTYLQEMAQ